MAVVHVQPASDWSETTKGLHINCGAYLGVYQQSWRILESTSPEGRIWKLKRRMNSMAQRVNFLSCDLLDRGLTPDDIMARPSAAFSSVEASQYPCYAEIAKSDIASWNATPVPSFDITAFMKSLRSNL